MEDGRQGISKIAEEDGEKKTTEMRNHKTLDKGYDEKRIARITTNKTEEEGTRKVDEPDRRTDTK
jgi:hypothetical protein